jgi:hypothetical protein
MKEPGRRGKLFEKSLFYVMYRKPVLRGLKIDKNILADKI